MNQPHPSADEIVAQATAISDPQQRSRFVADSCAGNPSLRRQVAARLGDPAASASQLQETTDGAPHRVDEEGVPAIGSRIGPYQLMEEIGEGGMGIVFLAAQNEPVRRRVALKVIKVGMDTRRVVARFETERQTLALMDHPCITKVLDAGTTENGRPYFVMELVQGEPITRYCDALRLPVRRRLEVFVQVCHALEHAHQKGIIHRDIKPTNVLVTTQDGTPLPKIIDFGIAKATAERDTGQSACPCRRRLGTA